MGRNSQKRDAQKKTGLKKLFSRIIKRKTDGHQPDDDHKEPETKHHEKTTNEKQPNNSTVDSTEKDSRHGFDISGVLETNNFGTGTTCGHSNSVNLDNMPVENLPRNRRPIIIPPSEEENLLDMPSHSTGTYHNGSSNNNKRSTLKDKPKAPSSPNTEKALQLLQKLEAKRKGDITNNPSKILQRTRRSRSNKAVVTLLQNSQNIRLRNELEESSYESMNSETQSLASSSAENCEKMDIGEPLASSTLQKQQSMVREGNNVKQKKRRCDKQAVTITESSSVKLTQENKYSSSKQEQFTPEETTKQESDKENKLDSKNKSERDGDKAKTKSSNAKSKHKTSEEKSRRKRQSKILDKTSIQPLIKKLDDKVPLTLAPESPSSVKSLKINQNPLNHTSSALNNTANSNTAISATTLSSNSHTTSNTSLSEVPRPVIHYHVTLQNCDGININVNKSDSNNFIPQDIEVNNDGKLQKLSWIENPDSTLPIGGFETFINPLTNSSESWSGTSTSTIIAGHENVQDDSNSVFSLETNTTVLMTADINFDDALSDMTCDTTYLANADAWGCDGLQDEDFEHLSVCEHKSPHNSNSFINRSRRDRFEMSNKDPFHLNRNSSFSKSVPNRLSRHSRAISSPAFSRSKDFKPPWRSDSTNSVPTNTEDIKRGQSLERSQSSSVITKEITNRKSSETATKSKIPTRKPSTRSVSRLFHNLLNPSKHNFEDKKDIEKENIDKKSNSADNVSKEFEKKTSKKRFGSFSHKKKAGVVTKENKTEVKEVAKEAKDKDNTIVKPLIVQTGNETKNNESKRSSTVQTSNGTKNNESKRSSTVQTSSNSAHSDISESLVVQLNFEEIDVKTQTKSVQPSSKNKHSSVCSNETKEDTTVIKRPITPFKDKNDQRHKPVAKVTPMARVSPVSNTPTPISVTNTPHYTSYNAGNGTNSISLTSSVSLSQTANINNAIASTSSSYQSAFSRVTPSQQTDITTSSTYTPAFSRVTPSQQTDITTSTTYTPAYPFSSSYSRRYTPIFTSSDITSTASTTPRTAEIPSNSNHRGRRSVTPIRRPASSLSTSTTIGRGSVITLNNNVSHDFDSDSDSILAQNDTRIASAYDDSTLSLLEASPNVVLVDEDLDDTSRPNFSRYGLGSTIQPTLRRRPDQSSNSSRSRGRRRSSAEPSFEERIAALRVEIVRVPGVLILSTRRNRMVVYLSQDRPNVEGVFEFMQQRGISRADYEVEILPWGHRGAGISRATSSSSVSSRASSMQATA